VAGAVYLPEPSTVPPLPPSRTDHATLVDCPSLVPLTVAVNVKLAPGATTKLVGKMNTEMTPRAPTVTTALSCFEVSAMLVATT